MMVYLDMCSIQRPLDAKTQSRIAVEAETILGVLALVRYIVAARGERRLSR